MWSDNETNKDFLNFRYVADIAAETIASAGGRPLSIGVSGSWGVGKSSMMKLLGQSLRDRSDEKFLLVEFNAWLYQGYDDTRAALMEIVASALLKYAEENKSTRTAAIEGARSLLARVDWFRLATAGATTAASLAIGIPPVGLIGTGIDIFRRLTDGKVDQTEIEDTASLAKEVAAQGKSLFKEKKLIPPSPPKAIHAFRSDLEATLNQLDVTLIVLIDDLDRCLPLTAISTLEAMRLFLFLENTAFVIAADDQMIREAVRAHFKDLDLTDDLITNYFDKLIQVPLRVPPLGTQDVRAYLMLLFVENSILSPEDKDRVRREVCARLGQTWSGKRVDRSFLAQIIHDCPDELKVQLELADRLAPLLTTSTKIAGNPRLIKRFLNTLSIRQTIARSQGVNIDEAALAKMLLFERCAGEKAYTKLLREINDSPEGRPEILRRWEEEATQDPKAVQQLPDEWNSEFVREWLALQPPIADMDMRGIAYVSREHLPLITAADRLSSEGASFLEALLSLASINVPLADSMKQVLPLHEINTLVERLLARARSVNKWGTPPILYALLTVARIPGDHIDRIADFLSGISRSQLEAPIIPLLADKAWAKPALTVWAKDLATAEPVKRAIANAYKKSAK